MTKRFFFVIVAMWEHCVRLRQPSLHLSVVVFDDVVVVSKLNNLHGEERERERDKIDGVKFILSFVFLQCRFICDCFFSLSLFFSLARNVTFTTKTTRTTTIRRIRRRNLNNNETKIIRLY